MTQSAKIALFALTFIFVATAFGVTRHVDNVLGNDQNDGLSPERPVKSVNDAIKAAQPGDVIKLKRNENAPYIGSIYFNNVKGEPGKPIILDGQMAVIRGCLPITTAKRENVGARLFRLKVNIPKNALPRYFLVFNGKINRMGRVLKGETKPFKGPWNLATWEWTYVASEGAVYGKLPAGLKLSEADIMAPILSCPSGVLVSGGRHVVIKNLIVEWFWNDGFSARDHCRDISFENIMARYNGDDGICAHDTCEIALKNYVSIGNGTGMSHVGDARTTSENCLILASAGYDIGFFNPVNSLRNVMVKTTATRHAGLQLWGRTLIIDNGLFESDSAAKAIAVIKAKDTTLTNVTFKGYQVEGVTPATAGFSDAFVAQTASELKTVFGDTLSPSRLKTKPNR